MTSATPWSIKGIDPKTREKVKRQAREAGMTMGEWLSQTVENATNQTINLVDIDEDMSSNSEEIKSHTQFIHDDEIEATGTGAAAYSIVNDLNHRQKPSNANAVKNAKNMKHSRNYAQMNQNKDRQATSLRGANVRSDSKMTNGFNVIESALSDIVDHIELTDKNNSSALRNMQAQIAQLSNHAKVQTSPVAATIQKEFGNMEDKLSSLAQRIDELNANSAAIVNTVQDQQYLLNQEQAQREQFEQNDMLTRFDELFIKLDNLNNHQRDYSENVKVLEEDMQNQLDNISGSLSEQLSAEAESYDQGINQMDARLSELSERLEVNVNNPKIDPQIEILENQISQLGSQLSDFIDNQDKVNIVQAQQALSEVEELSPEIVALKENIHEVNSRLEENINAINSRLEKTEQRLEGIDRIENNMVDLIKSVSEVSDNSREVASEAALEAIKAFSDSKAAFDEKTKQDVNELISKQMSEISKRNSEVEKEHISGFKTVQTSLETIMDRLAKVENTHQPQAAQRMSPPMSPPDRYDPLMEQQRAEAAFIQPGAEMNAEQPQDITAKNSNIAVSQDITELEAPQSKLATTPVPKPQEINQVEMNIPAMNIQAEPISVNPLDANNQEQDGLNGSETEDEKPLAKASSSLDFIAAARQAAKEAYEEELETGESKPKEVKKSLFSKVKKSDKENKDKSKAQEQVKPEQKQKKKKFSLSSFKLGKGDIEQPDMQDLNNDFGDNLPEDLFEEKFFNESSMPAQNANKLETGNELQADGNKKSTIFGITANRNVKLVILGAMVIVGALMIARSLTSNDTQPTEATSNSQTGQNNNLPIKSNENATNPDITNSGTIFTTNSKGDFSGQTQTPSQTINNGFTPDEFNQLPNIKSGSRQPTAEQIKALKSQQPLVTNSIDKPIGKTFTKSLLSKGSESETMAVANLNKSGSSSLTKSNSTIKKRLPNVENATDIYSDELPEAIGPELLRKNAIIGKPVEQFEIAYRYAYGVGVDVDYEKAFSWFVKAADNKLAVAQYSAATMLENGKGTLVDMNKATHYYQQAAEQGNLKAIYRIAMINAAPRNPTKEPDFKTALKWFNIAANAGLVDAQFNLAVLYEKGHGTTKDLVETYKWYTIAGKKGDKQAAKRAEFIKTDLTPAQILEANSKIKSWKISKLPLETNIAPKLAYLKNEVKQGKVSLVETKHVKKGAIATNLKADKRAIKSTQKMLKTLGWNVGAIDGIMGSKTRNAIKEFQTRHNLAVTGVVNDELLANLEDATL